MSCQLQVLAEQELYSIVMTPEEPLLMVLFILPRVWVADETAIAAWDSNLSFSSTKTPRSLSSG